MKKHLIYAGALFFAMSSISYAAMFQAGDIENGQKWPISKDSGIASYFATGKSGRVEFTCELHSSLDGNGKENAYAMLRPGKNFNNPYNAQLIPLSVGVSPVITWILTDEGENNGNIKVSYVSGEQVTIQCKGKKLDA